MKKLSASDRIWLLQNQLELLPDSEPPDKVREQLGSVLAVRDREGT